MLSSNGTRDALLRALSDQGNSYRQRMRPADIIQQCLMEHRDKKPFKLTELLKKLVRLNSKS